MIDRNFEVITIPDKIDHTAIDALIESIEDLRNAVDVRTVILTGSGEAFSKGYQPQSYSADEVAGLRRLGQSLSSVIEGLGKPVIAAINGHAFDAGLEIAIACTWRICLARAEFGLNPIGAMPGFGGALRLSRVIGKSRAHDLILTGRRISAAEALDIGLVNQVLADQGQLMNAVEDLAIKIGSNAPLAVKYALQAINAGSELTLEDGLRLESTLFGLCFATQDFREGTRAFLEKRRAEFKGK